MLYAKMGKDNSDRYKQFFQAYTSAFFDASNKEQRKINLDAEWKKRWKNNDDETEFKARLEELKSRRKKTSIFHAFNQSATKKAKYDTGETDSSSTSTPISAPPPETPDNFAEVALVPSVDLTSISTEDDPGDVPKPAQE